MRHIIRPFILCLLLATTSCSTPSKNINNDIENTEKQIETGKSQAKPIEAYVQPAWRSEYKYSDESLEELVKDFPATLIDELSQSVYESRAESFIKEINDKTLMTSIEQINIEQGEYLDEILYKKNLNIVYYQADTNGDGVDEIFIITKGTFNSDNHIIMLTLQDDIYVYAGSRDLFSWIDGIIDYAVIQDEKHLYVAASFRDKVSNDNGICVAAINCDSFGENKVSVPKIFIQQKMDLFDCVQEYRGEKSQLLPDIEVYIEDALTEILYNSRWWGSYIYGDGVYTERKGPVYDKYWSIDANNDGINELYNYHHVYGFTWYDNEMSEIPWQLEIPQNILDDLDDTGRVWFKVFDGKTIIFSLYEQEDLKNGYIIDARICEDGNTKILLNYRIRLEVSGVRLSKKISYGEIDLPADETVYQNLDYAKAFPQGKLDMASDFVVYNEQEDIIELIDEIPVYLAEKVVAVLSNDNISEYDFSGYDEQIEKNEFFEQYAPDLPDKPDDSVYGYYGYDDYVYKYRFNNINYYLLTHLYHLEGDDGYYSRWITIYKELDGKMILYNRAEFRSNNLKVFLYDNDIYVITKNIRDQPGNTGFIAIFRLQSDGKSNYAKVEITLQDYRWEKIYGSGESSETTVNEYLEEIKKEQLSTENINTISYEIFHGDETKVSDHNRLSRINTVEFHRTNTYEIDFNNDGQLEYILYNYDNSPYGGVYDTAYKFGNSGLVKLAAGWTDPKRVIVQLWFKELNDKIYTFQLLLCDNSYYILNVSLIEDSNITQVQNYLILPEVKYELSKY